MFYFYSFLHQIHPIKCWIYGFGYVKYKQIKRLTLRSSDLRYLSLMHIKLIFSVTLNVEISWRNCILDIVGHQKWVHAKIRGNPCANTWHRNMGLNMITMTSSNSPLHLCMSHLWSLLPSQIQHREMVYINRNGRTIRYKAWHHSNSIHGYE